MNKNSVANRKAEILKAVSDWLDAYATDDRNTIGSPFTYRDSGAGLMLRIEMPAKNAKVVEIT